MAEKQREGVSLTVKKNFVDDFPVDPILTLSSSKTNEFSEKRGVEDWKIYKKNSWGHQSSGAIQCNAMDLIY